MSFAATLVLADAVVAGIGIIAAVAIAFGVSGVTASLGFIWAAFRSRSRFAVVTVSLATVGMGVSLLFLWWGASFWWLFFF